ncbi:MAG: GntR family transcriptional regulator [Sphingomicrobium sp.]
MPSEQLKSRPKPQLRALRRSIGSTAPTSLPIYHQLYVVLRQKLMDGYFAPDTPLPAEFALSDEYGVSRVTVRRTLDLLGRDGLIVRKRGIGTFAAPAKEEPDLAPMSGVLDNLITIGLNTKAKLVLFDPASRPIPTAAQALGLQPTDTCLLIQRLRIHRDQPFSVTNVWVSPRCAPLIDEASLGDQPVVTILEAGGACATCADQTISAVLADHEVGELLDVAIGSPLIRLRRIVTDANDEPILYQQSLYQPDKYEYHMTLQRDNSTARPHWRYIG